MSVTISGQDYDNDDEIDYSFEYSLAKIYQIRFDAVVFSDKFTQDGVCWQLEMKRICSGSPHSDILDCNLHLITTGADKTPKLARICLLSPDRLSSPAAQFQQIGDKSEPVRFKFNSSGKVQFGIEVLKCLKVANAKPQITLPKSQMVNVALKWFQSADFGDTILVASDGQRYRCHRGILASRSPVFKLMFTSPVKESREILVKIESYEGKIVVQLLVFIYIDDCGEIGLIADRLYAAADHYKFDRLKRLCESAMAANLSADNIVKIYRLATFYHLNELLAVCADYLDTNKAELPISKIVAEAIKAAEEPEAKRSRND